MFAESLILCTIAGLLGLLVAGWGFVLVQELAAEQLPRINELGLDLPTLVFAVVVVVGLAAVFAKLSSAVVNYDQLQTQLQSSGKGSGLQISSRTRNVLIATQITLATVLLAGSSAVIQQSVGTVIHPLGFNDEQVVFLRLAKPKGYEKQEIPPLTRLIRDKIAQLPQVEHRARAVGPPIYGGRFRRTLNDRDQQRLGNFSVNHVDSNYFDLLEIPLLQGRNFTSYSSADSLPNEIIVSESLALFLQSKVLKNKGLQEQVVAPNGTVIGRFFNEGTERTYQVVGIVADYFNPGQVSSEDVRRYYRPNASTRYFGFEIKLKPGVDLSKQTIIKLLQQIDPKLRMTYMLSHSERHQTLIYHHKLAAGLTILLSLLALVLAAAGIYGVLNYSTQMRRYELGIHLALGAKTHTVQNMVLKESLKPVLQGLGLSAVLVLLGYLLAKQQFSTILQPDVFSMGATLVIMLAVAFTACYLPVKKVIMDDPIKALRNE
ncbi:MAG: ABC transporter permease, partial [Algicola sp.]|nr:ABC transporter permease [Algicola sp.]